MKVVAKVNRRQALKTTALTGVALSAADPWFAAQARPRSVLETVRLGLILKMKRDLELDWKGTLKRVAAFGLQDIEFPGFLGPSPQECRTVMDDLGLTALGGGAVFKELDANLDEVIASSQVLGKKYVYCYWPWLDGGKNKTTEDWKRLAQTLNKLGGRIKAGGLMLAYHNHDIEFIRVGPRGPFPYDLLLQHTDPTLMTMQMDLFWVDKASESPVPFLHRYPGRFTSFHIKERSNTPDAGMLCSGESFTNLGPTLTAGARAGVKHFIIENEDPNDHYACAHRTLGYLKSLKI